MELIINTESKVITLYNKVNIGDLLNELDKLGLIWDEWTIQIEPQIITIKEPCKKDKYDNPWITPYPWVTPQLLQPIQPYYIGDPPFDSYKVTCYM